MKETKIYKIRVTGEVLETANATRRVNVDGQVLTFGREPVYVRAAELPPQLADDRYLRVETVDSAPDGVVVIELKPERVQDPAAAPVARRPAGVEEERSAVLALREQATTESRP